MNESLKKKADERAMVFSRAFLQFLYEDMFLRNAVEGTMIDPDGRKNRISIMDLRNLINQLPETSDEVEEAIRMMDREKMLKSRK